MLFKNPLSIFKMEDEKDPSIDQFVCVKHFRNKLQKSLKDLDSYTLDVNSNIDLGVLSRAYKPNDDLVGLMLIGSDVSDASRGIHEESIGDPELSSTRNEDLLMLENETSESKEDLAETEMSLPEILDEQTILPGPSSFWTVQEESKIESMPVNTPVTGYDADSHSKRHPFHSDQNGRFSRASTFSEHSHFSDLEVIKNHPGMDQLENVEVSIKVYKYSIFNF